jgi:hypothetical protein
MHKYSQGAQVFFRDSRGKPKAMTAFTQVLGRLPGDDEPAYKIKRAGEPCARAVLEHELSAADPAS